jgi:glycosyltransferase involved in cell wall biosynthesis
MNNSPMISVIMPVYNGEEFLREAIESILDQTYKDFEFLILYDESSDDSFKIIQKYAALDSRVKLIKCERTGIIGALNKGIKLSKGDFIARMDADDICFPERFEKQIKFIEKENLDICGGDFIIINNNEVFIEHVKVPKTKSEIILTMGFNVPFAHPSVMIKKEFLRKNKLFYGSSGKKYAEDLDMWITMFSKRAVFGNLKEEILKYRILNTSLSRVNSKEISHEIKLGLNNFINQNKALYKNSLLEVLKKDELSNDQQKMALRGLFKYLTVEVQIPLVMKTLRKVNLVNFLFVCLSEVKQRVKLI